MTIDRYQMNNWEFTDHLLIQLSERKLSIDTVVQGLSEPDEILVGKKNRVIYHKILGNKLLRIIVEDNRIITAYMTSKIKKYLRD